MPTATDGTNGTFRRPRWPPTTSESGSGPTAICQPPCSSLPRSLPTAIRFAGPGRRVTASTLLDVYLYGRASEPSCTRRPSPRGGFFGSLPVTGVTAGSQIVVTQTVAADGTSAFSAPLSVCARDRRSTNTNEQRAGFARATRSPAECRGAGAIWTSRSRSPDAGPFTIAPSFDPLDRQSPDDRRHEPS